MKNNEKPVPKLQGKINKQVLIMDEIRHFDKNAIIISPSILKNKLYDFEIKIKKISRIGVPLTGFLSILPIVVTVKNYEDKLGIPGNVWHAIMLLALIIFFVFLIINIASLIYEWFQNKKFINVESFVNDLKNEKKKGGDKKL